MSRLSRQQRIEILAWSLLDLLPQPTTATGALTRGQKRAPSPSSWSLCPDCRGDGELRDRFGNLAVCGTCRGAGRYRVDPYTEQQVATLELDAPRTQTRRAMCDRCGGDGAWKGARCEPCDGSGKVSVPLSDDEQADREPGGDRVLDQLALRDRLGSWHALDLALEGLRRNDRQAWHWFVAVHVEGRVAASALVNGNRQALERAYGFLSVAMPERLRIPASVVAAYQRPPQRLLWRSREERDREIVRLVNQGRSVAWVAQAMGVGERQVQRIVYGVAA